jgi:hypothetical protein
MGCCVHRSPAGGEIAARREWLNKQDSGTSVAGHLGSQLPDRASAEYEHCLLRPGLAATDGADRDSQRLAQHHGEWVEVTWDGQAHLLGGQHLLGEAPVIGQSLASELAA